MAEASFAAVLAQGQDHGLPSSEHFTVAGTWIEAWASQKSSQRKERPRDDRDDDPGNRTVNFRGERRSHKTRASTTDPEARLARRKGRTPQLASTGHLRTRNRYGLIVSALRTEADGHAERLAALEMIEGVAARRRIPVGADKGHDPADFVAEGRMRNATPHVAPNTAKPATRIDGRRSRHEGSEISRRKRIAECFGWMKTVGLMRKTRHKGTDRVGWMWVFTAAADDRVRIRGLVAVTSLPCSSPSGLGILGREDPKPSRRASPEHARLALRAPSSTNLQHPARAAAGPRSPGRGRGRAR